MTTPRAPIPAWPLLMDRRTARAYLDMDIHEFRALEISGLLPPSREPVQGILRWHREELDASMARLWGLKDTARHDDQAAAEADRALDGFTRRKPALRGRAAPRAA